MRYELESGPPGWGIIRDTVTQRIVAEGEHVTRTLLDTLNILIDTSGELSDAYRYQSASAVVEIAKIVESEARHQLAESIHAVYQRVGSMRAAAAELGLSSASAVQQAVDRVRPVGGWSSASADPSDRAKSVGGSPRRTVASREDLLPDPEIREKILHDLRGGSGYRDIQSRYGVTPQRMHGWGSYSKSWAKEFDRATMDGRDPDLIHGRQITLRRGCICPECRNVRKHERVARRRRP